MFHSAERAFQQSRVPCGRRDPWRERGGPDRQGNVPAAAVVAVVGGGGHHDGEERHGGVLGQVGAGGALKKKDDEKGRLKN